MSKKQYTSIGYAFLTSLALTAGPALMLRMLVLS